MNIGIDARWIFRQTSGIGAYTAALVRALVAIEGDDRFTLFFNDQVCRDRLMQDPVMISAGTRVKDVMLPYGLFSPWNQVRLPAELRRQSLDIFHSPNYMIPLPAFPRRRQGRIKVVVTIHDVIPLLFPHAAPKSVKSRFFWIYRRLMREIGQRAHVVISDSEASRQDVIRQLSIPPARQPAVVAIPCGVDTNLFRPANGSAPGGPPDADAMRRRIMLYVGRADPYKNLAGLLRALASARAACPFPLTLRIAGPPDPRYPEAHHLTHALGLDDAVEWTGYLTEAQLVEAYQGADLLVLPSYYEGFGLPVIEAMASGTPVVCSNRGSLPEVAGDAAVVVDPDDGDALAEGIKKVLTDTALQQRLRRDGLQRAATFTWDRTARETLRVYHGIEDFA